MASAGVCVVVGVGPGIGQAVARRFGREGYSLGLIARKKESLAGFVETLAATKIKAKGFPADAESAPSLGDALKAVEDDLGSIDVVIYNAAAAKPGGPLEVGARRGVAGPLTHFPAIQVYDAAPKTWTIRTIRPRRGRTPQEQT